MSARNHIASLVGATLPIFLLSWQPAEAEDRATTLPPFDNAVRSTQGSEQAPEQEYSVLGKGPVHEAYAQPYRKDPRPTPIVPRKAPAPIVEEPPQQKPKGDNLQWIPGYWSWDPDKNDFIWVSGLWRVPPLGRQWIPGYWAEANDGDRWIPGYWAEARQAESDVLPAESDYLPEPPASLEYGPSVPQPDNNSIYEPGCWVYRSSGYRWRPGFWTTGYADWVWNPPYYSWTPAGCTYVSGYWDYPLAARGLLFAPVCFNQPLWENPGWTYRPNCVLGVGGLLSALFCRPDWCSYYYGNYFSPAYARLGFWPWCGYGWHGYGYDPLFSHYGWVNRFDPGWYSGLRGDFLARRNGNLPAPAGTLARQAALASLPDGDRFPRTVTPLHQLHGNHVQLTRLDQAQLAQQRVTAGQFRTLANQRVQAETSAAAGTRQTFGTATPGRFGTAGKRPPSDNVPAGQTGTPTVERFFHSSPGKRTSMPSQGDDFQNRSGFGNGLLLDARSAPRPTANLGGGPVAPGRVSRQSSYSGTAVPFGRPGGQGLVSHGATKGVTPFSPQDGYPASRGRLRADPLPQKFDIAPAQSSRSPSHPGSSYRLPSFSRSAPSFHDGSPSFHAGRAPSFHGAAPNSHGGVGKKIKERR